MSQIYSKINCLFKDNGRNSNIKKNILGSFIVKGVSIITQLLLVPLTINYVSSETYGIWLTISSIILWIGYFDAGFSLGLKNRLAEAIANNDMVRGKTLVSTTYFLMFIIFIPMWFLLEIIIPLVDWPQLLNVNASYREDIILTMRIVAACFCIQMIAQVLSPVAAAFQKVALSGSFPVIGNALSLIIIIILTYTLPPSLYSLSFAISFIPVIVLIIFSLFLYRTKFKDVSPNWKYVDTKYINNLFGLGFKFFLIQIQLLILFQTTNFLISYLSGPESVTQYNIAYKYFGTGMMIFYIIISPFWPAFTDAYTKRDFVWMNNIYDRLCRLFFIVLICILFMLTICGYVYTLWIGDDVDIPVIMSVGIAIFMIIQSWFTLQINLINGIGSVYLQTIISIIGMVLHIPLSLFLGHFYGAMGVVYSMTLITLVYSVVFTIQLRKILSERASGIWLR